jgi:hypothetical protein
VLLGLIAAAELALIAFAMVPAPFNAACLFLNGLALGMVFGLVLGFVEGRRLTELFIAGLCASFILADGVSKSAGAYLLKIGVGEAWMPSTAGLIFALPLVIFVWMLQQIPAPTAQDESFRCQRAPMKLAARLAMLQRHGTALGAILLAYLCITVLRSLRADFAPELWKGLGFAGPPALFSQSELWVALAVTLANGALVLVKDNRRAYFTGLGLSLAGLVLALAALAGQRSGMLAPFPFMVLLGIGLYLPYVAVHTTLFERLIALTREKGNLGYLMYLADTAGYLGYAVVMMTRSAFPGREEFTPFFVLLALVLVGIAILGLLAATVFHVRFRHPEPRPVKACHQNV